MRFFLALLLSGLFATPVLARAEGERVVYSRHTVINLTGRVIEGAVEGPQGTIIFVPHRPRFGPVIRLRQSFRGELLRSAADL